MTPQPIWGTYIPGEMTHKGSFLVNGTSDPDGYRDGKTGIIEDVERVSAGLFRVTLADNVLVPEKLITQRASLSPNDATPAKVCVVGIVEGTWNPSTRKFDILCTKVADTALSAYADPAPDDPDDNSRISFEICGSMIGFNQDA